MQAGGGTVVGSIKLILGSLEQKERKLLNGHLYAANIRWPQQFLSTVGYSEIKLVWVSLGPGSHRTDIRMSAHCLLCTLSNSAEFFCVSGP